MKKIIVGLVLLFSAMVLLCGCHHTGRQIRKSVDALHDLIFEGSG
jgi:hypothetical protein